MEGLLWSDRYDSNTTSRPEERDHEGVSKKRSTFSCWKGHLGAEDLDGVFEALSGIPEVGPEIAFSFEARADGFDIETLGLETRAELARLQWCGNGCLGKRADGVRSSERAAFGILRNVNEDATRGTFCDDAFAGDEIRILGSDAARDDFREGAQLFVGINGLDGNKDVESGGAGSFQKVFELERFEFFVERFGDRDDDTEFGAVGWIEVEEEIIRMGEIV